MIETEHRQEIAVVLNPRNRVRGGQVGLDLDEAVGLVLALEADIGYAENVPMRDIHAANYFGGGKINDVHDIVRVQKATLVVVNTSLSPIQQRNLERHWKAKVIDRTGLILEIFGLRAATKEGRLQVEMARLAYERSRLVRTWTHLERQRGGQGFLAGPGETQIESDRRVLNDKIAKLRRELDDVRRTRSLQRQKRKRAPERIVSLVGYTNAGKSTLFNVLTEGGVLAKDMLFATLDTTHRILPLPNGKPAVMSDTVGFIADLPTDLVSAFRATLEEVKEADLLVHVRDMSDPLAEERKQNVLDVLNLIEAGPEHDQDIIEVWNKVDQLDETSLAVLQEKADASRDKETEETAYMVSAVGGQGIEELREGIEAWLSKKDFILNVSIPPKDFHVRAWLHQNGQVMQEQTGEAGECLMSVQLSEADAGKFLSRHKDLIVA